MNLNRRLFVGAAVSSTAAVLQTNASPRVHNTSAVRSSSTKKPVEVDIIDPAAAKYFCDEEVDVFARLDQNDGGDPGVLSGFSLRILDGPMQMEVDVDAVQRDGATLSTCLGQVDKRGLLAIAAVDPADEAAGPVLAPVWPSGLFLELMPGTKPEMSVSIRQYPLGVLRGRALQAFLGCLRTRLALTEAGD